MNTQNRKRPHLNNFKSVPIAFEWTIKEEALLNAEKNILKSQIIEIPEIPNVRYHLEIHLNSMHDENEGPNERSEVCCYLFLDMTETNNKKEIYAKFEFNFKLANKIDIYKCLFQPSRDYGYGGGPFCYSEELFDPEFKYFVNEELLIKFSGTLMMLEVEEENEPLKPKKKASKIVCCDIQKLNSREFKEKMITKAFSSICCCS